MGKSWHTNSWIISNYFVVRVLVLPNFFFAKKDQVEWKQHFAIRWLCRYTAVDIELGMLTLLHYISYISSLSLISLLYIEFFGVDKAKHGEVAYPVTAWIENQYTSNRSSTNTVEPVGPVGKSVENMKHLSKGKSPAHKSMLDSMELTTSNQEEVRGSSSNCTTAVTVDPANFQKDKIISMVKK